NGETVDLGAAVARARRELPAAIEGRVVAIAVRDPAALLVSVLAVLEAGGVAAPLDVRGPVDGLIAPARPIVTLRDDRVGRGAARRPVRGEPARRPVASGPSGRPKGVVLGRKGLEANLDGIPGYLPVAEPPRTGIVLPLVYSYALVGQALLTLRAGGTVI